MEKDNKYVEPELSHITIGDLLQESTSQLNGHYVPEDDDAEDDETEDDLILGDEDELEGDEQEFEVDLEDDVAPGDADAGEDDLVLDTEDDLDEDEDDEDEV